MKDGTMFSTIEPKNNVLPILISHFKNRMKREKFAIFDSGRKMIVYYDGEKAEIFFVESLEIEWSDEEIEYSKLWKTFHKTISIKERENKKLQQSNLPKYYWKYLVEDMQKGKNMKLAFWTVTKGAGNIAREYKEKLKQEIQQ